MERLGFVIMMIGMLTMSINMYGPIRPTLSVQYQYREDSFKGSRYKNVYNRKEWERGKKRESSWHVK